MSAVRLYVLACDHPGCSATTGAVITEVASDARRRALGWRTNVPAPKAERSYGPKRNRRDYCPEHSDTSTGGPTPTTRTTEKG